jgi:hypothetical protein
MQRSARSRETLIDGFNIKMTVRENRSGAAIIKVTNTEGLFGQYKKSDFDAFRDEFNEEVRRIRSRRI